MIDALLHAGSHQAEVVTDADCAARSLAAVSGVTLRVHLQVRVRVNR